MNDETYTGPGPDAQCAATRLAREDAPSLKDMLDDLATPISEGVGAWSHGWYRAKVLAGYTTGKGKVFETRDVVSDNQSSRNIMVCFAVAGDLYVPISPKAEDRKLTQGHGGTRNIRENFNYRPADLTPEGAARIKASRAANKGVAGAWADKSAQASSLSIGRIGQLQKALGSTIPFTNGRFNATVLIGQEFDVEVGIDAKGFNKIKAVAPAGSKVR